MIHYLECAGVFVRFRFSIHGEFSALMMRPNPGREVYPTVERPLRIMTPFVNEFFQDVGRDEGFRNMVRYCNAFMDEFAVHFSKLEPDAQADALTEKGFPAFREVAAITLAAMEEKGVVV